MSGNAKMRRDGDEAAPEGEGWQLPGPPYDWSEIEDFLTHPPRRPHDFPPSPAPPRACEYCGNPTHRRWWTSSPETWRHLCGQAGDLDFCPNCKAWYPIDASVIS